MANFSQNTVTYAFIKAFNLLKEYGFFATNKEFAESIDYLPQSLGEILKGRRDVTIEVIRKLVSEYPVSLDYLFTGEGNVLLNDKNRWLSKWLNIWLSIEEKTELSGKTNGIESQTPSCKVKGKEEGKVSPENTLKNGKTNSTENESSNGYQNGYFDGNPTPLFLPESGKTKSTNIIELPVVKSDNADMIGVPVVDISVAAGYGFENPDYLTEVDAIYFPKSMIHNEKNYLCVRIKGESMAPTLQDGGYLVIRLLDRTEWQYIREGYVYVVSDREGRAYVKRLKNRFEKGFIVCRSDNPDVIRYPSFNLYENEINTIWYAEWYVSAKMPNIHATFYTKVDDLENKYDDVLNQLQQVRRDIQKLSRRN